MKSRIVLFLTSVAMASPLLAQDENVVKIPAQVNVTIASSPAPVPDKPKESGLAEIIKAKFPLALNLSELGNGWREFDYGVTYFTKGDTTFINGHEYLIVYKKTEEVSYLKNTDEYRAAQTRSNGLRIFPTARLRLDALPMEDIQDVLVGGNSTLRSFSLERYRDGLRGDKASVIPNAYYQNLSLIYLRKINEAVVAYGRDYISVLPPLESSQLAREALLPYSDNATIFIQPGQTAPFRFNPLFSGRKRAHLNGKGSWVLAYEPVAAPDGSRAVLTLNGRVSRVSEKTWNKLREASKLD